MIRTLATAFCGVSVALVAPASAQDREDGLRCSVPADAAIFSRQAGVLPVVRPGGTVVVRQGQPAPQLMVEGWQPPRGTLGDTLTALGREAGFAVVGAEGLGTVSWDGRAAPLSAVLDSLTSQVGASWSFSSGVVRVSRSPAVSWVSAVVPGTANRDVTLALLDTLRGYEADRVSLSDDGISFRASPAAMARITAGLSSISDIYAFDVSFLRGRPASGRYPWSSVGSGFVADGVGGRILIPEDAAGRLGVFLKDNGDVEAGGMQTVAGPAGWAVVVPQSQCGTGLAQVTLRPRRVGDGFSLRVSGLGADVEVPMVELGQTLVVAGRDPQAGWIQMVSIRPRIVVVR